MHVLTVVVLTVQYYVKIKRLHRCFMLKHRAIDDAAELTKEE